MNNGQKRTELQQWIRDLRESKGMTQARFAEILGYKNKKGINSVECSSSSSTNMGYGALARIIRELVVRPPDNIFDNIVSQMRESSRVKGKLPLSSSNVILNGWSTPIWTPRDKKQEKIIMAPGEWIRALRKERNLSQGELARILGYRVQSSIYAAESPIRSGVGGGVILRIMEHLQLRPNDTILNECLTCLATRPDIVRQFKEAKKLPVWMPNGKEDNTMAAPATIRGETIKRITEKQEPTDAEKINGKTVALLREIRLLRKEISELDDQNLVTETKPVEPRTSIERIRDRLLRRKNAEIEQQAKTEAKATLYEELHVKLVELTAVKVASLKSEIEKASKHYEAVLRDMENLTAKVKASQDELYMLSWSLDNAFAYLKDDDKAAAATLTNQ